MGRVFPRWTKGIGTVTLWYAYGCGTAKTGIRSEVLQTTVDVDMIVQVFAVGISNRRYSLDTVVTSHNDASELTIIFVFISMDHLTLVA